MHEYFPCSIEKDAEETEWSGDDEETESSDDEESEWSGDDEEKMDTLENDVADTTKLAEGTTETTVGGKGRRVFNKEQD
jgi:hypothetical protein